MLPGQIDLDANVRIWNGPDRSQLGDRSSVGPAPPKAACPRHNHPCTRDGDREFTSQNLLLDTPMPGQSTGLQCRVRVGQAASVLIVSFETVTPSQLT